MNTFLIIVTLGALAAAAAFATIAWQAADERRRRSAARVAALASAIGSDGVESEETAPIAVASLFSPPADRVRGLPLVKAGVVGALGVALIVFVTMATSGSGTEQASASAAVPAAEATGAPLELMSMKHGMDGTTLTVSGLVRNPRTGHQVAQIAAVVFAFDRDGQFIASARAPLDFTILQPGDESPFVVVVPRVQNVGRYRVSFRTESGTIGHVDRRAGQVALGPREAGSNVATRLQASAR